MKEQQQEERERTGEQASESERERERERRREKISIFVKKENSDQIMTKILCHKVCKNSYFKTSTILKFKMPTKLAIFLIGTSAFIVANLLLSLPANAYQLPIQQHLNRERHRLTNTQHVLEPKKPSFNQPLNVPELSFEIQRRSGDAQKGNINNNNDGIFSGADESDELRELHQAVDTVAKLLNEEEQQQKERQHQNQNQHQQHGFDNQGIDLAESSLHVLKTQPELLSENAIREAIKQLEQVQEQERRETMEAESKLRPTIVDNPSGASSDSGSTHLQPEPLKARQATLSGLIEELGDEFTDEQMAAATPEAERVLGQAHMPRTSGKSGESNSNKQSNEKEEQKLSIPQESQHTSSLHTSTQKQPQQEVVHSSSQNSHDKTLLVGQLDSLASELGPALTNDFYTFHADSNGSERGDPASVETLSPAQNTQYQDQSASLPKQQPILSQSDLESAAQTRNSITQQDPAQTPFRQDSNTVRFDFNQPASPDSQQLPQNQPRQLQSITNNQNELIRAFRQQTGANTGSEQYPTTTLIPISGQDSFWRPSEGSQADNTGDIGQQYSRALASGPQTLPPLPQSRFQSSNLSGQFSQPASSSRQAQHIHYTGHSLIPSAQNTPQFQASPQVGSNRERGLVSTTAPLISVLSGSDTSSGNSVLWNPPSTLNPPALAPQPQSTFNSRTQASEQSPNSNLNGDVVGQFYPPPNRGPPSPLFSGSFQGVTESALRNSAIERNFRSQPSPNAPSTSTEANSNVDVTTEERFAPPTTTAQWSPPASSERPVERDVSDSQPRSSFRSLQNNNQRFFSPNDLIGPSSTLSSVNTELPRTLRQNNGPTVMTTTPSSSAPNNTAKKEDMVIYYYYYYDDNKNATVVAKNVTSPPSAASPSNLDAAIEADGGIEDTPYMDDPAPIMNPRPNSPPTSTTTSTTTTSTTTTTATPLFISSTFPSSIHDNRFRNSAASSRAPSGNEYTSGIGKQTTFDRELSSNQFNDFVKPTFVEQPRAPVITTSRGPSTVSKERQSVAEQSFTSTPFSVPSTSSFKPISRVPANRDSHASNRIAPTEPSTFHSSSTHSTPSRLDSGNHHRHQQSIAHSNPAPTLPNTKLQTDLIQNVLNGINISQPRQVLSFSTASTPVSSTASSIGGSTSSSGSNGRSPLSNASRYGTNNNLMLDPYGLDPAAPATLIHSSHASDIPASHHKNWQPTASHQPASHQFSRKPAAVTEASAVSSTSSSENLSSARPQSPIVTRTGSQLFASQRNSNAAVNSGQTPSRAPQPQPQPQPQAGSRVSGSLNRQFFPESNNQVLNSAVNQNRNEQIVRIPPKQTLFEQNPSPPKAQPSRQTSSIPSEDFNGNRLTEESTPRLQSTNGRPSTPDGNTGNGFTRSPIHMTPVSTPSPSLPSSSRAQISSMSEFIPSSPLSTTQPSISTSVSRSFVTPQQVQVTTSISQPTFTSTATSTSTSTSQSSSLTPATLPQQSTSTVQASTSNVPSTTSSSTTTTTATSIATQEPNQPTESSDSASASTRKKFGNRTNRFQTRINSLSASRSTSTTTTTTPSPSVSSTTRRPTTSTTRKSSKQLFPGRRRLSSAQQQSTDTANSSATATTASNSSSTSASSASDSPSMSTSGRSRFGNSFTARTRLSTPSSNQIQEQGSTTQKPTSLFGAQRATSKPRLPFLKPSKPVATATNGTVESGQNSGDLPSSNSSNPTPMDTIPIMFNSDKLMTEKSNVNETGPEDSSEDTSTGSTEDESAEMKKDLVSPTTSNNLMVSEATATAAPSPSTVPDAPSGRNKPKLRPLFASRQRSSSLFGNRRSNSTSTTTN